MLDCRLRNHRPRRLPLLLVLLAVILLPSLAPLLVQADGEIVVTVSDYENRYPAEIRFIVSAESASQITKVTLRYKPAGEQATSSANAQFSPGTKVQAEYIWNTQRDYVPPGVELQYYWQIEDAAGHKVQTAASSIVVADTRFQWQTLTSSPLTLYWYSGDKSLAQEILDAGGRALNRLAGEVGVTFSEPVKIVVYANQRDLLGALPPRGVEWVGGEAFPAARVVVLTANTSPAERAYGVRTVAHELTHLVVHAATDNPFGGLPRWLDEGLAMYSEGKLPANYQNALDRAVAADRLLSLRSLTGNFPTDAEASLLGYAESYNIVKYMLATFGRDKMSALLGIFHDGSTQDDAMRGAYGKDVSTLEADWRASIGAKALSASASPMPVVPPTPLPTAITTYPGVTPTAVTAPASQTTPSSGGGSCFGGLTSIGALLAGVLVMARRFA